MRRGYDSDEPVRTPCMEHKAEFDAACNYDAALIHSKQKRAQGPSEQTVAVLAATRAVCAGCTYRQKCDTLAVSLGRDALGMWAGKLRSEREAENTDLAILVAAMPRKKPTAADKRKAEKRKRQRDELNDIRAQRKAADIVRLSDWRRNAAAEAAS